MEIIDNRIDGGKAFDWGKTSKEYAKYRDIYPDISGFTSESDKQRLVKEEQTVIR